jgi:hypothetical protein
MRKRELIAGVGALVIYVLLPDILTRFETALAIGYFAAVIWLLYGWAADKAAEIREGRERLQIKKHRRRSQGRVDVKLRGRAVEIPAYRVEG